MHLKFSFTQNEVKQLEAERIIEEMYSIVMPKAKELSMSEANTKIYIEGFIKAIALTVSIDHQHIVNKDTWAISNEYIYTYISRFRGKNPKNAKGKYTTNGRMESVLMSTFLMRHNDYNFISPNSITSSASCKQTYDLHPLLWEAIRLENFIGHQGQNWKATLLTEGIKGISYNRKADKGSIPLYGLTSVKQVCINGGNILDVQRSTNRGTNNAIYGVLQKAPTKWIGRTLKRLDTLTRAAEKLKTPLKRKGRLLHIDRMREYCNELYSNGGFYIDFYRKTSCGRYFSVGMTLQNFSSSILKTLFRGEAYEIDQSTSHPTIIRDLAADFGIFNSEVNDYIANKDEIINEISIEAKMRKNTIKTRCILSTCYGHINQYHAKRHPKLWKIVQGFNSLLADLKNLLGEEIYNTIYREEVSRTENIIDACGGWDNLLCWRHDGVIMTEMPNKKLKFNVKINSL